MSYAVVNGIRLYYELHGQGPPLTLVEGQAYATWMWFRQVDALAARHRVLVYDNRDVGKSDKLDRDYAVHDMAHDLAALLDTLGIAHTHLLGVSLGGFIAMEFALAHPEKLDRLVLACTTSGGPEMVPVPPEVRKLMEPDLSLQPEQRTRKSMAPAWAPGYAEAHPEVIDAVVKMRLAALPPPEAAMRHIRAGAAFDISQRAGLISAPALVLHGEQDRVLPVENARQLVRRLPHAELCILPAGGHLFFIEQADRFNQAVLDFLQ